MPLYRRLPWSVSIASTVLIAAYGARHGSAVLGELQEMQGQVVALVGANAVSINLIDAQ